jgi:hypothetical protein
VLLPLSLVGDVEIVNLCWVWDAMNDNFDVDDEKIENFKLQSDC